MLCLAYTLADDLLLRHRLRQVGPFEKNDK
jgi:hypothetical protein